MTDVLTPEQRRLNMSRIRGSDTKPELIIRKALHAHGFRYRLHERSLPGRPDIVLPRHNAAIFVHGCFWHSHRCHLVKKPKTRTGFWEGKLGRNAARDRDAIAALQNEGWKVAIVWECALRGATKQPLERIIRRLARHITGAPKAVLEIAGREKTVNS